MVSSQIHHAASDLNELVSEADTDFGSSGLKRPSAIRVTRLAVVEKGLLVGAIGEISEGRLLRIRRSLSKWIVGDNE